jgi:hypothetical protein
MRSHRHEIHVAAAVAAQYIAGAAATSQAIHCACAAHRDESKGFVYTAAIQWRRAADLFGLNTLAVEYCWRQWERIMRLPRKFAVPICDEGEVIDAAA